MECRWDWLGIDTNEWSPQKLDWDIHSIEHLAFARYMDNSLVNPNLINLASLIKSMRLALLGLEALNSRLEALSFFQNLRLLGPQVQKFKEASSKTPICFLCPMPSILGGSRAFRLKLKH